jgi:hypothetical protein
VCHPGKKKLKVTTISQVLGGKVYTDKDTIRLRCLPSPNNGCDPMVLYTSTFDRIQKQVFNQSCAVSSCHDSNTKQGDLLLETGASFAQLVNHLPSNAAAFNAGWTRVTVTTQDVSGDPDTSFLYHKVSNDLPDAAYGNRMPDPVPNRRRKLHPTLIDLICGWIKGGAKQTTWETATCP